MISDVDVIFIIIMFFLITNGLIAVHFINLKNHITKEIKKWKN